MALWRQFTRGLRALVRRSQTDRDLDDEIRQSLALDEADAVYTTPAQWRFADDAMSLVVRTRNDPLALATPVRQAVWAVDKDQPVVRVATMESLLRQSAAERRFALIIFQVFAAAALLLAAAGVYGVLAGSVAERVRELVCVKR